MLNPTHQVSRMLGATMADLGVSDQVAGQIAAEVIASDPELEHDWTRAFIHASSLLKFVVHAHVAAQVVAGKGRRVFMFRWVVIVVIGIIINIDTNNIIIITFTIMSPVSD
jgi:hypothetical protein